MNRIYKVIWSKTKNCYVVASELVHGNTKATNTGMIARRAALAAVAALLLLPAGSDVFAASTGTTNTSPVGYNEITVITGDQTDANAINTVKDAQISVSSGTTTVNGVQMNNGDINANDITAKDINAKDINAKDINAKDITATGDISAKDVTATGDVSAKDITASGTIHADGVMTSTGLNTQGGAISGGAITGTSLNTQGGDINGGAITGTSLNAGTGAVTAGSGSFAGNVSAGSLDVTNKINGGSLEVTGDAKIGGTLDVKEFNADKLQSKIDANNFTTIEGGSVHSKNFDAGPEQLTSESTFDKTGRTEYARDDDSIATTTTSADGVTQDIRDVGDHPQKMAYRELKQTPDGYMITDEVKDPENSSTINQKADQIYQGVTTTDGTTAIGQSGRNITTMATDGTNTTTTTQDASNITNEAKTGTITNDAKDIANIASEDMTNTIGRNLTTTVGGEMTTTVTGDVTEDYKADLSTTVGGDMSTEVTGDQSTTVHGDQSNTVEGTLTETVTGNVTEDYKADLSTTVSGGMSTDVKGNQSNIVEGTLTETVTGDVTEDYQSNLSTTVSGDMSTDVKGNQSNTVEGNVTETIAGDVMEDYQSDLSTTVGGDMSTEVTGDQSTTVHGDQSNTVEGTLTETITGKATENYNGGLETTITGEEKHTVNGSQITNITSDQTNTIGGDMSTEVTGDQSIAVYGNQSNTVEGNQTTTIGGDMSTTVTGDSSLRAKSIINEADTSITDMVGTTTITTTDGLTTLTNREGTHKTQMDFAEVGKDLSVGGNATVGGSMTASSYKVGDKTYIDSNGINANNQTITNVAPGELSATSTDAVNGAQLFDTNQKMRNFNSRLNRVGAGAAALAALHPLDFDPDSKWDFAAGYGNYRDANAAAVGLYYRPNEDTMFSVGGSFGGGENMVNAGVSLKLGRGSHVSNSRVAMAKEIRDMRKAMAEQAAEIAELKAMHHLAIDPNKSMLFPDVADNHWAYEYVTKLAGNGIIEGYPDGLFKGNQVMTRYEFAAIVYRLMEKGMGHTDPEMNRLAREFSNELSYIRIDTVHQDKDGTPTVQRVRVKK